MTRDWSRRASRRLFDFKRSSARKIFFFYVLALKTHTHTVLSSKLVFFTGFTVLFLTLMSSFNSLEHLRECETCHILDYVDTMNLESGFWTFHPPEPLPQH